jgi:hypothetical protein
VALVVFAAVDFPLHVPVLALVGAALAVSTAAPARAVPVRLGFRAAAVGACMALWLASDAAADLAYLKGAARVSAGDLAGATSEFGRALFVQPAHALSLEGLAEVDPGNVSAPERLASARRLRPAWTAPVMTAFDRALAAGDSGAAARAREESFVLDPEGLEAGIMGVRLALHAGSRELAARQARELAARWPGSFDAALLLADIEIDRGRREEARRILDTLRKGFPGSAAVRERLGRLAR